MIQKYFAKRGQSNLLVILLLVVIGIVAIVIFWNIFNTLLKHEINKIDPGSFKNEFELKEAGIFVTGASRVNVLRKSGNSSVDSLKFVFEDDSGKRHTESIDENIPKLMESYNYFFSPISEFGKIKKITVYPVINGKTGIGSGIESNKFNSIPSGLISWWKLEGNIRDSVNDNNGQLNGNVQLIENEGKKSIYFDSGNIDFGNDSSLNLNNEFAILFWIKTNSVSGDILNKGSTNPNYRVFISEDGKIDFSFSSQGRVESKKSLKKINDGIWHHVIITNLIVYIDGEKDNTLNVNKIFDTNSDNLIFGEGFKGYLGETMLFNKSLDSSQAKGIFNSYV